MPAITATNSATPSLQSVLSRTRLAQAQREASQAEANAQNLRAQADEAERESQSSQNRVRVLSSRSRSVDPTYASQIAANKTDKTQMSDDVLLNLDQYSRRTSAENNNHLKNILNAIPVVSRQGEVKGRFVNESV
jgi:uncharacterized protein YaiL (DUF2058 family)